MGYKIQYLPLAVQDLNGIANDLSNFYPNSTVRVLKLLREKIEKLAQKTCTDAPNVCGVSTGAILSKAGRGPVHCILPDSGSAENCGDPSHTARLMESAGIP